MTAAENQQYHFQNRKGLGFKGSTAATSFSRLDLQLSRGSLGRCGRMPLPPVFSHFNLGNDMPTAQVHTGTRAKSVDFLVLHPEDNTTSAVSNVFFTLGGGIIQRCRLSGSNRVTLKHRKPLRNNLNQRAKSRALGEVQKKTYNEPRSSFNTHTHTFFCHRRIICCQFMLRFSR